MNKFILMLRITIVFLLSTQYSIAQTVNWATYFGGSVIDRGLSTAVDGSGNIYMAGSTTSISGIATTGAHQTTFAGSCDVFLAKFSSAGALLWATYYGGSGYDSSVSVTTDGSGNVYISGMTTSTSGIATAGTYQTTNGGGMDIFIANLIVPGFVYGVLIMAGAELSILKLMASMQL